MNEAHETGKVIPLRPPAAPGADPAPGSPSEPGSAPGVADSPSALDRFDLEMIAAALADQGGWEHRYLLDPVSGEVDFRAGDDWSYDDTDDGDDEADEDGGLIRIEPLPSRIWFRDMADFARGISDERAARRLSRALDGRGAFRRFKNVLHDDFPDLVSVWRAFSDNRGRRRAVDWLAENDVIDEDTANAYLDGHPDPDLP